MQEFVVTILRGTMRHNESIKDQVVWIIKMNPGIVRTEIRDMLKMANNVVTPCIKELIDQHLVVEGDVRVSKTTNRPGKTLYIAEEWARELDSQYKLFE